VTEGILYDHQSALVFVKMHGMIWDPYSFHIWTHFVVDGHVNAAPVKFKMEPENGPSGKGDPF